MSRTLPFLLIAASCAALASGAAAVAKKQSIVAALRQHAHSLAVVDGELAGDAVDFLLEATRDSQFVLLGEQHNVQEIAEITALMFRLLHDEHGFDYHAMENGPVIARLLSAPGVVGDAAATEALVRRYPYGLAFTSDQEVAMLASIGAASTGKGPRLWGTDQEFGALHVLDRLRALAADDRARAAVDALTAIVRPLDSVRKERSSFMSTRAKPPELLELEERYRPSRGSEAEFLIQTLLLSDRIYRPYYDAAEGKRPGAFYESGLTREESMKDLFLAWYKEAEAAGDQRPKVLLRYGAAHMMRGINPSRLFNLGAFVRELARSHGLSSFALAVYAFGEHFPGWQNEPDYRPLAEVAGDDGWTLVDLRPLRGPAWSGVLDGLKPQLLDFLFDFDAVLLIARAHPATFTIARGER